MARIELRDERAAQAEAQAGRSQAKRRSESSKAEERMTTKQIARNRCFVCGREVSFGNNVSHANNKTRRVWKPNLQVARVVHRRKHHQGQGVYAVPPRRQGPAGAAAAGA